MPYPLAAARGRTFQQRNGLRNNLIAYWKLDEAGGANNALDAHSNGLTLTQVNSPGSDTGLVYAGARTFAPASTQQFTRNSETLLQAEDKDITVAAWVYIDSKTADRPIVSKYGVSGNEYLLRYQNSSDRFRWVCFDTYAVNATTFGSPSTNTWYLVICSHDAANNRVSVSVNAGTVDSANYTGTLSSGTEIFRIGQWSTSYFSGRLGPIAMWKSAAGGGGVLSSGQRSALYNSGNGLAYASFTT